MPRLGKLEQGEGLRDVRQRDRQRQLGRVVRALAKLKLNPLCLKGAEYAQAYRR